MAMKLLDLYKSMMNTAGLIVTEDHLISAKLVEQIMPVMIKGKRLALPAPDILARQDKSDLVIFHPLMEQVSRGESEIVERYRKLLMLRFNEVAATLMLELLTLSGDIDAHKDLSPDQSEFLTKVKNVDGETIEVFRKVLGAMPADQTAKRIVTLFLKKTGSVAGKRHKRVGVVSFPLYEELKKPPTITMTPNAKKGEKDTKTAKYDIYGVKCRVRDRDTLLALFEYLFPNIEEVGSYNRGSDSDVAANLDALMQSALTIIQALNDVTETFATRLDKDGQLAELFIDCDWQETFVNLGVMLSEIRKVPMQAGNEGATADGDAGAQAQQALPASYHQHSPGLHIPATTQQAVATQQPAAIQHPTGVSTGQPLDTFLAQREAERTRQQQFEQGWRNAIHQPAGAVQQQVPYQPFIPHHQQQQVVMAPQQPVHTGRGLDFGSILATNPAVLYATGGPAPVAYGQHQAQPQTSRFFAQWQPGGAPAQGYYHQQQQVQQPFYPQQGYQRTI